MGNYNPNAPIILGEEWVPIRDVDLVYDQAVNSFEVGHAFTLTSPTQLGLGKFYIHRFPDNFIRDQIFTISVYPKGTEDDSGPIRSVVIPCNNGGVTGAALLVANTVAEALWNPSASSTVQFNMGGGVARKLEIFFAVDQYSQLLQGKRILGLDFLTNIDVNTNVPLPLDPTIELSLEIHGESQAFAKFFDALVPGITPPETIEFVRRHLGDTNFYFNSTNTVTAITNLSVSIMPWTFNELRRFEATYGVGRLRIFLESIADSDTGLSVFVSYGALEVFFCEERRVAVGSHIYQGETTNAIGQRLSPYNWGLNTIQMFDLAGNPNPVLPAGEYVVTLSQSNLGDDVFAARNTGFQPVLNATQELYTITPHEGVRVNIPFPMDTTAIGKELTSETTHIIPQVTLHATGGSVFTQMQVYGRQSVAQVYGNFTATQEILDSTAGASYSYPWVRYYARRFGDTTVPLRLDSASPTVSGSGMGVFLSPAEWDELPEIIDGWKQVTLRFPTAPTMGSGITPTWRWSATGELAGNRWEVLGCTAPALSGNQGAGTLFGQAPSTAQLSSGTYGAPSAGATVNEGWLPQYAPFVSAPSDDQTSDAVLIFSQDMPAVSGFTVSTVTQAVSGIGQDCGLNPCGIPTAIYYNRLSWTPDVLVDFDDFHRTSASGWGTSTSGHTYNNLGGTALNHTVNGTYGQHTMPVGSLGSPRRDALLGPFLDTEAQVTASVNAVSTGAALTTGLMLRAIDSANHYRYDIVWNTNNTVGVRISSVVAGVATLLTEVTAGWYSLNDFFTIKARIDGSNLYAKIWKLGDPEPEFWQANAVNTALTAAGGVGPISEAPIGNTNTLPVTASYYGFTNVPVTSFVYELQRMDTVDNTWETIMLGGPLVSGFSDYEARVGIVSSYRIREVNSYGFYGPWTSTLTATITDPGLVAGCLDDGHVLIFSSNSRQDGSVNLAYASVWEGQVDEDFTFPESSWVQLQSMYNKDFYTAFRPLERGGDRFQRQVLVQAAAISPETLGDFTGLRDMAWDSVPYVCVRDEDGNRWFATIVVPSANVRLNRSLYVATVDIIEVTDTPAAVSP
jgi:hypothetical protein